MIKRSVGERVFSVVNVIFLCFVSLIALYPFLYVVFSSFSEPSEYMKHTGLMFMPAGFSLEAYRRVFQKTEIFIGYLNTIIYVVGGTTISMLLTVSLGYALSRKNLYWNRLMTVMIIITMYFYGGLIPSYLLVKSLGMVNTRWAVMIPTAISTFNLIIMRTAFEGVPDSLEESAKIDGASQLTILVRILIPLVMPNIAVVVLYYAVAQWNGWFQAAIYLRDASLYPLQLYLREILIIENQQDMLIAADSADQLALGKVVKHATVIVSTIPILCVYPYLQKYFTKGVMIGAVKG